MNNQNKAHNPKLRRNNQVFAFLMILSQIGFSIVYGITYRGNPTLINISAIVNVILLAILVVVGFGLVFSYLKRLLWSGLGFTFLITALSIEVYPLINNFWTKTLIHVTPIRQEWSQYTFKILLTNSQAASNENYGNCISNAIKCALAISISFSSILGRVGALECFIVTVIGTIGFQLNRQVILTLSNDSFGTYFIFTYGGFMGLALGIILRFCKEKLVNGSSTSRNIFNRSNTFNSSLSMFGSLVIFALFPFLAYDVDNTNIFNIFYLYTGPLSLLIGMGASLIGSICVSTFFNNRIVARDLVHAPIAGGIIVGSASYFITTPVYAMVAGFSGGFIQSIIQNLIQKPYLREKSVISTISWSLFGIQGLLGGVFATGYQRIIMSNSDGFTFNSSTIHLNPGYQLLAAIVSAGIGLGFGLISGLILLLIPGQRGVQHFMDQTYWNNDDGLKYKENIVRKLERSIKPAPSPSFPPPSSVDAPVEEKVEEVNVPREENIKNQEVLEQKNVRIEYSEVVPFEISTPQFQMSISQGPGEEMEHVYL